VSKGRTGRLLPSAAPATAHRSGAAKAKVAVVDDDPAFAEALFELITALGIAVEVFGTAHDLRAGLSPSDTNCLILDVRLPDKSGLELHAELKDADIRIPVVFVSGYADVRMSVRAMKAGAVDFLTKPFGEQEFLDAMLRAVRLDGERRYGDELRDAVRRSFDSLTLREQQLMKNVVAGKRNKVIATALGVSEITVKAHRAQMMKKMAARSVPQLVAMSQLLGHREAQALELVAAAGNGSYADDG
jgi:FixJ family two-component response regulator